MTVVSLQRVVVLLLFVLATILTSRKQRGCEAFVVVPTTCQTSYPTTWFRNPSNRCLLHLKKDNDEDDEDDEIDLGDQDWRAFRAKLVMSDNDNDDADDESTTTDDTTNNDVSDDLDGIGALFDTPSWTKKKSSKKRLDDDDDKKATTTLDQWAYNAGTVIEQGAVILGGVEQDYGFGLRQQYFHKAAILVLDHDVGQFTKGIILNRPTDFTLQDDMNEGVEWRVWFGGDVQGLSSASPDIVCLHSLSNKQVVRASIPVMKDIQWTTFDNAKRLVQVGAASPSDFWVFCGYAGWGPNQLMGELDRKSWYMVATDSQTLLKELARQAEGADPRDAGLDTWNLLMSMIGRQKTAKENTGGFDDLMLKEWALKNLLSVEAGGGGGGEMTKKTNNSQAVVGKGFRTIDNNLVITDSIDDFLESVATSGTVAEGTLVRASSADRSPFLLHDQELHKSLILIISDTDQLSVGVILNRPAAKGIDIQIKDRAIVGGKSRTEVLPLRYGGQYSVRGTEPLLWLHCNNSLKAANIGSEIGSGQGGIYKCTVEDVSTAIGSGMARPEDFMVVTGVSVWQKNPMNGDMGMQGQVRQGNFEVIQSSETLEVWRMLQMQHVLSNINLAQNLALAGKAWLRSGGDTNNGNSQLDDQSNQKESKTKPIRGLGDNFDDQEDDDSLVFKSDVKVSDLSDKALRSWVATFLLGAPTLDEP